MGDKKKIPQERHDLESKIYKALEKKGWTIPTTRERVVETEKELTNNKLQLPIELKDPENLFNRKLSIGKKFQIFPEKEISIEENLARAARDGQKIPSEIEEKMKKDRESAERKK